MSDTYASLETAGNNAFAAMTAQVAASGVDAAAQWNGVINAKANLEAAQSDLVSRIEALKDNDSLPEFEKAARIQQLAGIAESSRVAGIKQMDRIMADFEASLIAAQRSDLVPAESAERVLIRQEIDQLVAAATQGTNKAGEPYRAGDSMLLALTRVVQSNPTRYGAEVLGDYGKIKMQTAGEQRFAADLERNVMAITPGTTPKSQTARALLKQLQQTKGRIAGINHIAQQRLEAAVKPKPVELRAGDPRRYI